MLVKYLHCFKMKGLKGFEKMKKYELQKNYYSNPYTVKTKQKNYIGMKLRQNTPCFHPQ